MKTKINYSQLKSKMDKFMPSDLEVMENYYDILYGDSKNPTTEGILIDFFEENVNIEDLKRYMPKGGSLKGFTKYLINSQH